MKAFKVDAFFGLYLCMQDSWKSYDRMQPLNLPQYPIKIEQRGPKTFVFDIFRRRFVALTPEEWVRQHFLRWLHKDKGYPASLISVEASLEYNKMKRRADAIIYTNKAVPLMIVECKSATQKITRDVFDQVARYNFPFGVDYLVVTNGLMHYCCLRDENAGKWLFLDDIPAYDSLVTKGH